MTQNKITIIGGGVPGLTTAILLAKAGCEVILVERGTLPTQADIKPTSRTAALMNSSIAVLKNTGAWQIMAEYATPLTGLSIVDDSRFPRGGDRMIRQDFKAHETGQTEFGFNIPLLPMTAVLAEKAKVTENLTILENTTVTQDHPAIMNANLVIGADGRKSVVRKWAGIGVREHGYDQSAITCLITHSLPHHNTSTEFHRGGGPCTFVPAGEKMSAVVWAEENDQAEEFLKLPKDAFLQALQERSRGILGQITDVIVAPSVWPLMMLRADALVAPKTALIAEAAHVMSPIGAQGLNLSLRDVDDLVTCLKEAMQTGQDVGGITVLKNYERLRRADTGLRVRGVDMFHRIVANKNPILAGLRRFGLQALDFAPPLRGFLIEEGWAPRRHSDARVRQ